MAWDRRLHRIGGVTVSKAKEKEVQAAVGETAPPPFRVVTCLTTQLQDVLNDANAKGEDVFSILEEGGTRDDVTVVFKAKETA